jgi:hypothetical protein
MLVEPLGAQPLLAVAGEDRLHGGIAAFAWPMNLCRAFALTPAAIIREAKVWRHS